jgi:hypothetical protein
MNCPGLHCPGCGDSGGGSIVIIAALAIAAEVIIDAFWWLVAGTIAAAVISLTVVILLTRATARREAAFAAHLAARRPVKLTATATPQVGKGTTAPAIENHYHVHFDPADREAVRIIRTALPGMAGDIATEE